MTAEETIRAAALSDREIKDLILRSALITNYGTLDQIEQQGVDLRTREIWRYLESGFIGITKRQPPQKEKVEPIDGIYELKQGVYDIFFKEGCNFPKNISGLIKTRSSTNKCGAWITREFLDEKYTITSGAYDAGFKSDNIAGTLIVYNEYGFKTECGASLAKMLFFQSDPVAKTYNKKREKSNHGSSKNGEGKTIKNSTQRMISNF